MTTTSAVALPRVLLLIKADGQYKHSGKYYLLNGRWHKVHADKPAPKGAPVAAHPHAAGQHVPAKHLTDEEWEKLKLPAENVNAGTFNKQIDKLKELAEGGHVSGILGMQYGTNTYSKKLAIIANHILGLYGSEHKVTPGQKAGSHPAVSQAPASATTAKEPARKPAPAPAAETPAKAEEKPAPAEEKPKLGPVGQALKEAAKENKPDPHAKWLEAMKGKKTVEVDGKSYYVLAEGTKWENGTTHVHLASADEGKVQPNGWNPKQINVDIATNLLHPDSGLAMPEFAEGKTKTGVKAYYEKVGQKVLDLAAAGDVAGLEALKADGMKPNKKGKVSNTWAGKTANSKTLLELHAQALAKVGGGKAEEPAAEKPKAKTPGEMTRTIQSAISEAVEEGDETSLKYFVNQYPEGSPVHEAAKAGMEKVAKAEAEASAPAPEPEAASAPAAGSKVSQIPWDSQLLPDSNTNSKSHNGKVAQIKAMAEAGDLAGLEAFKAGKNTYGQKQMKLAALAIAALKEDAAAPAPAEAKAPAAEPAKVNTPTASLFAEVAASGSTSEAMAAANTFLALHGTTPDKVDTAIGALEAHGYTIAAETLKQEHGLVQLDPEDEGPHEGDTKQGANGMLVFKDGRWHKQEQAKPQAAEPAAAAAPVGKKLKPSEAIALGKNLKTATGMKAKLKKLAVAGDVAGLQEFIAVANGMPASKMYAKKLVAAMTDGAGEPAAAQPKAAPVMAANGIESMEGWTQTGPQGGSNPGGKFKDQNGVEWYCKFPSDPDVAKSEILAAKLYALAGVTGQDAKLITKDGKIGIASKWTTVSKASPAQLAQTEGVMSGFATDAWLANWDVVGLGFDNLQVGADGKAVRVDAGGSLAYRAQGGKKAFGNLVTEIDSLRDAKINPQAAAVFGKMSQADITASVAKVLAIPDAKIRALVAEHGPGDAAAKKELADTLIARKADLAAKYPKAVKAKPPKPQFKVENLTLPPSFTNWNGSGKGLSSHQFINESNQAAVDAVYDAAKQGDLKAIQQVEAPVFDKGTGAVKGHVPLNQHPSQHVKAYWSDMVSEVDLQLNPPRLPEIGEIVASQDLGEISSLLKPVPAGGAIALVPKHHKAGEYILLGKAVDIAPIVPESNDTVIASDAWKSKAVEHYKKASAAQKSSFSLYVTTSGARSLNTALRKGDLKKVVSGQSVATHVENFKGLLVDIPEGSTFVRRMGMKGYGQAPNEKSIKELQQFLLSAEAGTVMQEPGFTSTSWTGGNKILGNNDIEWEFVAGKGVKMFPAWLTANQGEGEGLLPPNQRYMIVSSKKDGKTVRVKAILLPTID